MDADVTVVWCRCDRRKQDQRTRTFRRSETFGGWVFYDVPTRTMSKTARYWALVDRSEYPHHDHTGEPYVFHECIHCGQALPLYDHETEGEQRPRPTSQSDGADPEE